MGAVGVVDIDRDHIEHLINSNGNSSDGLIPLLQDIQSKYNYLPEEALRHVAKSLGLPMIQVYGVATFFKAFSLEPKGRHRCTVCMGTACHVRGASRVLEELERKLNIKSGDTTADMEYSLETVNCVGACALGPMVLVDGEYYATMNSAKVKKLFKKHTEEQGKVGAEKSEAAVLSRKRRSTPSRSAKSVAATKNL
jgi:NADH:ubiquinone oxidoreductase subunit E